MDTLHAYLNRANKVVGQSCEWNIFFEEDLAAEHLFENGGCRCQILGFFGDKFIGIECTLEAETSLSNLIQYKLFIGDDKKIRFLE